MALEKSPKGIHLREQAFRKHTHIGMDLDMAESFATICYPSSHFWPSR